MLYGTNKIQKYCISNQYITVICENAYFILVMICGTPGVMFGYFTYNFPALSLIPTARLPGYIIVN